MWLNKFCAIEKLSWKDPFLEELEQTRIRPYFSDASKKGRIPIRPLPPGSKRKIIGFGVSEEYELGRYNANDSLVVFTTGTVSIISPVLKLF